MKCPICYFEDTRVVDSRGGSDGLLIRRRRECLKCNFRFSTMEEMEILDLSVIKRDGQKEIYSRDKIIKGLSIALRKRPISDDKSKQLLHTIERDIQKLRKNEIQSRDIGAIIMKHLKKVDTVAYIRFASVYEDFEMSDLEEEVGRLIKPKAKSKK